jgi:hypothetical protein
MESTIGLYKTELIKPQRPWKTLSQVELAACAWADWHNHQRLHGETGHVPPAEHDASSSTESTKPGRCNDVVVAVAFRRVVVDDPDVGEAGEFLPVELVVGAVARDRVCAPPSEVRPMAAAAALILAVMPAPTPSRPRPKLQRAQALGAGVGDHAALEGVDDLGGVGAEDLRVAEGAEPALLRGAAEGVRGVVEELQPVGGGYGGEFVHGLGQPHR